MTNEAALREAALIAAGNAMAKWLSKYWAPCNGPCRDELCELQRKWREAVVGD